MSIKTTAPPQTYSRLFRPWDSSDIKPDTDDSNHSFSDAQSCANSNSSTSTTPIKQSKRAYSLDSTEISARLTVKSAESMARTDLSMAMDAARLASSCVGAFSYPPTLTDPAALSYLGLDPFGIGLMEQEYARVLAEEAAAKQINAKKQRPKKFKCPHCDYAFSNNGQLKGHIRSHLGELSKIILLVSSPLISIRFSGLQLTLFSSFYLQVNAHSSVTTTLAEKPSREMRS